MNALGLLLYILGLVLLVILFVVLALSTNIFLTILYTIILGVPAWYSFKKGWHLRKNSLKKTVQIDTNTVPKKNATIRLDVYVLTADEARSYFNDISMHLNDIIENRNKRRGRGFVFKLFHPRIALIRFHPLIINYDRLSADQVKSFSCLLKAYSHMEDKFMRVYDYKKLSDYIDSQDGSILLQRNLQKQVVSSLYSVSLNSKESKQNNNNNGFLFILSYFSNIQFCPSFVIIELFPRRNDFMCLLPVDYSELEIKVQWDSREGFSHPESSDRVKDLYWHWEFENKDGSRDRRRKENRKVYTYHELNCYISVNVDSSKIMDPRLKEFNEDKVGFYPEFPNVASMEKFAKALKDHKALFKTLS